MRKYKKIPNLKTVSLSNSLLKSYMLLNVSKLTFLSFFIRRAHSYMRMCACARKIGTQWLAVCHIIFSYFFIVFKRKAGNRRHHLFWKKKLNTPFYEIYMILNFLCIWPVKALGSSFINLHGAFNMRSMSFQGCSTI